MSNIIMANDGTTYAIQKQLGSGSFGTVYSVKDLKTNQIFACKIITKALLQKYNAEKMIRQEIQIQKTLTHKNIVKVYKSFEDYHNIFIISEYCSKGGLVQPNQPYTEKQIFDIVISLLNALDYLHMNEIIHRDLKLDNIFLHEDGTYKLGDFGWATYQKNVEPIICGTTEYMPPEVVLKKNHDFKVDSWSLGVLIYILVHINYPFKANSQNELIQQIVNREIYVNTKIDEDLQILIYALLTKDSNQRPTIQQLYLSKWIKKQMKQYNIFNKYENEQLKIKAKQKAINLKPIEVSSSVKKCLSDSQKSSLTQSTSTQISSQDNPCSPSVNIQKIEQIFNFKDVENIVTCQSPKLQ